VFPLIVGFDPMGSARWVRPNEFDQLVLFFDYAEIEQSSINEQISRVFLYRSFILIPYPFVFIP